ncbi:MAG TPA: SRPBCC family protein [Ramlibacter sp.]|uniref:SRPBCC family protein n=1 Tax=Ramlibacter sp. TaxID=1917967 RepID=UPI002CD6F57D|nr:SRPBCC family protein [Ramlibacter sp.]HVZ45585.1 SRPBCC family protein [Ramlibacter sp.]
MPAIQHTIDIPVAPEALFDFVTNASQWHRWHPATHAVRETPSRPLRVGETVIEHIKAAHREFDAKWTVTACERPTLWRIETATEHGASTITYRLSPKDGGTHFERTCEFRSRGLWSLLDSTVAKWMLARQAAAAMTNLREVLKSA